MDFSFTCEIEKQPERIPQVSHEGLPTRTQDCKAAFLFVTLICPVTKLSVNSLSLGSAWSLRVIINYSALSSMSRQLGGLPKRHQESHYWRACSSPMNYTSLICLCCFCTVMDIKEQGSSAPWSIMRLAMLLIVFGVTVHSDINLEMEQ